jgi:hypothetical protein
METDLQKSFANVNVLLLLSHCELLRRKGVTNNTVDGLIQTITNVRERDRKRLFQSVLWVHQVTVKLVRVKWQLYWATKLCLISMLG